MGHRTGEGLELGGRAHHTIQSTPVGEPGEPHHLLRRFAGDAGVAKIPGIEAREQRHGDQQRRLRDPVHGLPRSFQHPPPSAGVHIDHPHSQLGGGAAGAGNGIGNIVELEVEKDLESLVLQPADDLRALVGEQLLTDFQPAVRWIETPRQRERRLRLRVVQCHDDGHAGVTHPLPPGWA